MNLNALDELSKIFDVITDEDIDRAALHFLEVNPCEKALGTIHSILARKMWAAAEVFEERAAVSLMNARFKAKTEEEKKELTGQAGYYNSLSEVAKNLFWIEARSDCGSSAWDAGNIGVRSGWMLVFSAERENPFKQLLQGRVPGGSTE